MRQLIITKETLATLSALKPGREATIELIDRETAEDCPPDRRDTKIGFRVQGIVGGGVCLFEPTPERR